MNYFIFFSISKE